jgi:hypothetical protein
MEEDRYTLRIWLEEWQRDLGDGKTVRALHERMDRLERRLGIDDSQVTGTGRFRIVQAATDPPARYHEKPWWTHEPFKSVLRYVGVGVGAAILGWLARHFGIVGHP